jgi:hypothetical protein
MLLLRFLVTAGMWPEVFSSGRLKVPVLKTSLLVDNIVEFNATYLNCITLAEIHVDFKKSLGLTLNLTISKFFTHDLPESLCIFIVNVLTVLFTLQQQSSDTNMLE